MDKQALREAAEGWLEAHAEEMTVELQGFARIRSVSRADLAAPGAPFGPECRTMLDYALKRAREMGFETEDHDGYCGSVILGDKNNAIGIFAHLDVVPEGDSWLYPPYAATRVGDFLIGRGVSDNKSAAVMALFVMRMYKELGVQLRHGIRLVLGCSEETGMQDMAYFREHVPIPAVSLVPDSSFPCNYAQKGSLHGRMRIAAGTQIAEFTGGEVDNMVPPHAAALLRLPTAAVRAALGRLEADLQVEAEGDLTRVRARGVAAHAAHPEGGRSALYLLADALAKTGLLTGQSQRAMESIAGMCSDCHGANAGIDWEDPDSGKTTMNIGVARMDGDTIRLHLDCRLSITADREANQAAFEAYARRLGFEPFDVGTAPPVNIPRDDPRIQTLQAVYTEVTGDERPPYTMGGGTYSKKIPDAITFGLGNPTAQHRPEGLPEGHGGAHAPDEFRYLPDLLRAAKIYAAALPALDKVVE